MIKEFLSQREKEKYFRSLSEEQKADALNEIVDQSEHIVFLGGAGVSTESGIPDFRSKNGLYHKKDRRFARYQPEYLLSYPDEKNFTIGEEADFLQNKECSPSEAEICAIVDGRIVGTAGVNAIGLREKIRHRASCGISIEKDYWGLGIGRALMTACIECAKQAGYSQLELEAVSDNDRAIGLYRSLGFLEYGRNPRGFRTRDSQWQELVLMRLELD